MERIAEVVPSNLRGGWAGVEGLSWPFLTELEDLGDGVFRPTDGAVYPYIWLYWGDVFDVAALRPGHYQTRFRIRPVGRTEYVSIDSYFSDPYFAVPASVHGLVGTIYSTSGQCNAVVNVITAEVPESEYTAGPRPWGPGAKVTAKKRGEWVEITLHQGIWQPPVSSVYNGYLSIAPGYGLAEGTGFHANNITDPEDGFVFEWLGFFKDASIPAGGYWPCPTMDGYYAATDPSGWTLS